MRANGHAGDPITSRAGRRLTTRPTKAELLPTARHEEPCRSNALLLPEPGATTGPSTSKRSPLRCRFCLPLSHQCCRQKEQETRVLSAAPHCAVSADQGTWQGTQRAGEMEPHHPQGKDRAVLCPGLYLTPTGDTQALPTSSWMGCFPSTSYFKIRRMAERPFTSLEYVSKPWGCHNPGIPFS